MTSPTWIDPGQGTNLIRVLIFMVIIILVRVLTPMVALRFQALRFLS